MTETKNETLTTYVGDVHALVAHGLQAIELQAKNLQSVSHRDVLPAIEESRRVLTQLKETLEARLEALGGSSTSPVKDAVSAIAGVAAGIINKVRASESVKSLRDDATYFSGLGVAYLLLYTTATSLSDVETAGLAQRGYEESARLVMHIDRILPKVTIEELREDKLPVTDTTVQVNAMVHAAWDRQKPSGL